MVVGEGQILGQTRDALRVGQEHGTVGPALNVLFQQALRVGKRSRAETDIDRAAPSLVSAALERSPGQVAGRRRVVVVGAGAMASLAAATVHRWAPATSPSSTARPSAPSASPPSTPPGRSRCSTSTSSSAAPTSSSPAPAPPASLISRAAVEAARAQHGRRWPSSTWRCRTTSTRPPPTCPG